MSKAKFAAARELIDEKQYAEARAILRTIDHPTARDWEARLNKLDPPMNVEFPTAVAQPKPKRRLTCGQIAVAVIAALILIYITSPRTPTPEAAAIVPTNGPTATNTLKPTAGPSPTITDTLIPSLTPVPSATPKPPTLTPTPAPLLYSGTNGKVIGPIEILPGTYKVTATTSGYMTVQLTVSSGQCGAISGSITDTLMYDLIQGQATDGAQIVFQSQDCKALINVSNVQAPWTLKFEIVG